MRPFNHTNAKSLAEVKTALSGGKTVIIAGGTDLLGTLKDNILPHIPLDRDQSQDRPRS